MAWDGEDGAEEDGEKRGVKAENRCSDGCGGGGGDVARFSVGDADVCFHFFHSFGAFNIVSLFYRAVFHISQDFFCVHVTSHDITTRDHTLPCILLTMCHGRSLSLTLH